MAAAGATATTIEPRSESRKPTAPASPAPSSFWACVDSASLRDIASEESPMARRTALFAVLLLLAVSGAAEARGTITCKLRFSMAGWSVFYKTASGDGTVSCDNGQRMAVHISAKGGGLTFGKSRIDNGFGEFSGVHDIRDVLGTYATAEAHAGASKSTKAQAMTKGEVSLALAGKGTGWDLGVAFGKFVISAR
jgi:hypothetical protein